MKALVIVDMQNDFVTGALGSEDAKAIVGNVREEILKAKENGDMLIFTKDTHGENYMNTQEGSNLPVVHCVKGTDGHKIIPELADLTDDAIIIEKPTFGSKELGEFIEAHNEIESVELIGVCTDICVVSNALLIKAFRTELPVSVKENCCAGTSKDNHNAAIATMRCCQVKTI